MSKHANGKACKWQSMQMVTYYSLHHPLVFSPSEELSYVEKEAGHTAVHRAKRVRRHGIRRAFPWMLALTSVKLRNSMRRGWMQVHTTPHAIHTHPDTPTPSHAMLCHAIHKCDLPRVHGIAPPSPICSSGGCHSIPPHTPVYGALQLLLYRSPGPTCSNIWLTFSLHLRSPACRRATNACTAEFLACMPGIHPGAHGSIPGCQQSLAFKSSPMRADASVPGT